MQTSDILDLSKPFAGDIKMNEKKSTYWIEMSQYDLTTAKAMLSTRRYLYVGFMCHQAIEKLLKGKHVEKNPSIPVPYIHNLVKLAKLTDLYDEMSDEHKDLIDILDPLNIEARYPSSKERLIASLTEERCLSLIVETEALVEWIKMK